MAVRPGGRRYNSEVKIITSLEKVNPAKRGLQSLGQLMTGLVLSGGKMQTFTEKLNQDIARSGVEANAYLTGLKDIDTTYAHLQGMITSLGDTDPINVDLDQFRAYTEMMKEVVAYQEDIKKLTKDQKAQLGITGEKERKLQNINLEYLKMKDNVETVADTLDDLSFIQQDVVDVAKSFEPLYNAAASEIGNMASAIADASDSSKEFFDMVGRPFSALSKFFSPLTDSLKNAGKEFAKDKISKHIYSKLIPSGEAAAGALQQGTAAAGGLRGMLGKLIPSFMGTTTAASGTAAATTAAGSAATGAGAGMASAGASAAGLTVALGPLVVVAAAVAAAVIVVVGVLAAFTKGLMMNIKTMEKYRQTSFRAAGSIRELTNATYDLSAATGLSNAEAAVTISALSEAGFAFSSLGETIKTTTGETLSGQKAMARLAETNAMFTKATGASVTVTASLQKSLTAMGVAVDKQEALFGQLTGAAAKYGITGEDLTQIVGALKSQSILLTKVLDDTDFNDYAAGYMTMAGAARELGIELGTVNKLMKEIAKGEGAAMTLAALGGNLSAYFDNDAANNLVATAEGAERVLKMAEGMQGVVRTQFLASFGGEEELLLLQKTAEKRAQMSAADIQAEKDLAAQRAQTQQQYNASLQTISQQMQRLFAPILAAIAKVVEPMVDMLVKAFEGMDISGFGDALVAVMEHVKAVFTPFLKVLGEGFQMFMEVFDVLWTLIEPLMPVFKLLGGLMLSTLIIPLKLSIGLFRILAAVLKPFAIVLGAVFKVVGDIAEWIMSAISPVKDGFMSITGWIETMNKYWEKALAPIRQAESGLDAVVAVFTTMKDVASQVWDTLFGSSLFHIMESITEDTAPALKFLHGLFAGLMSPILMVKDGLSAMFDWMGSAIGGIVGGIGSIFGLGKKAGKELTDAEKGAQKVVAEATKTMPGMIQSKFLAEFGGEKALMAINASKSKEKARPDQAPPAYTVQVEERANNQAKLIAQLSESSDMSRQILSKLLQQINGDTPSGRESVEHLKKLVDLQKSSGATYPDDNSGFGEHSNSWVS